MIIKAKVRDREVTREVTMICLAGHQAELKRLWIDGKEIPLRPSWTERIQRLWRVLTFRY